MAYGIHRTTLTQAAKAGVLGRSAYRSGDAWLIKTDQVDFWEWLQGHEYHPRVRKGYRKQQAARAAQQALLEESETQETTPEAPAELLEGGVPEVPGTPERGAGAQDEFRGAVYWPDAPSRGGDELGLVAGRWVARGLAAVAPACGDGGEEHLAGVQAEAQVDCLVWIPCGGGYGA